MTATNRPKGLLFDIGGVCVVSPFQAILDYELANNIPVGWINYAIQNTSPNGAWHRVERGEVELGPRFFEDFNSDFQHQHLWEAFQEQKNKKKPQASSTSSTTSAHLPLPKVDAEYMFWEMMRVAREPDPYMFPALKKLKKSGKFILGALSNTTILPEDHPYSKSSATKDVKTAFDFFISSAHCGLRKPDPRIYELAMDNMRQMAEKRGLDGIAPEDVVFLDDIGINLKWAKKAGMKTIKVNLGKTDDAVRQLEKYTGMSLLDSGDKARL
ncbi:hypothetical protein LOZ53_003645 [Ophidiomyces ophidiicola]|nr:hypothetical protein LOZ55_004059 [Ophidiomyces ophidiicola]KAI1986250.1 hypothetical protein LOZ54_003945 [Ophidiomyces ophidiicola]KAI1989239.1 hypothetical protein LOZ53_003645 [Ophidiomyces ophidiicola]KAI1994599.1 hypothetical protein LOZ51_003795 [Ophidiomyces ophidiicola]